MLFDFIVLCLACIALLRVPGGSKLYGRSDFWRVLFVDGMVNFLSTSSHLPSAFPLPATEANRPVACTFYLACTITVFVNSGMWVPYMILDVATVAVSIAACRSFVRIGTSIIDEYVDFPCSKRDEN